MAPYQAESRRRAQADSDQGSQKPSDLGGSAKCTRVPEGNTLEAAAVTQRQALKASAGSDVNRSEPLPPQSKSEDSAPTVEVTSREGARPNASGRRVAEAEKKPDSSYISKRAPARKEPNESGHNVQSSGQPALLASAVRDYGLDVKSRNALEKIAVDVAALSKNLVDTYIKLNKKLTDARAMLAAGKSGAWREWIENETPFEYKQAMRIIHANEAVLPVIEEDYGGKISNAWHLVSPTAFYTLASLNRAQIRQVIELAEAGEKIHPRTIKRLFPTKQEAGPEKEVNNSLAEVGLDQAAPLKTADASNPIKCVVRYLRNQNLECLLRGGENPQHGPVALLIYPGKDVPVSDWNGLGKARPADDVGQLLIEHTS